jgi:hypothetical protein
MLENVTKIATFPACRSRSLTDPRLEQFVLDARERATAASLKK